MLIKRIKFFVHKLMSASQPTCDRNKLLNLLLNKKWSQKAFLFWIRFFFCVWPILNFHVRACSFKWILLQDSIMTLKIVAYFQSRGSCLTRSKYFYCKIRQWLVYTMSTHKHQDTWLSWVTFSLPGKNLKKKKKILFIKFISQGKSSLINLVAKWKKE